MSGPLSNLLAVTGVVENLSKVDSSSLLLSSLELSDKKSMSLVYEPSSEPLHISAKDMFFNRELYQTVQL